MNFFEPINVGLTQLKNNKLRSILSLVGILIAVGSVTGIVSIGEGLQTAITREFDQMGGYSLIWSWAPNPWYRDENGVWVKRTWEEYLTYEDVKAIKAESEKVEFIVPTSWNSQWDVKQKSTSQNTEVLFTAPEYTLAENFQIANGRFLKAYDLLNNAKVCVLGSDVALNLFGPDTDPINKEVKIQGMRYTVVGVTKPKEFFDGNYNDRVMIPSTTGQKRYYGNDHIGFLIVKAKNQKDIEEVSAAMRRVYKRIHVHGNEMEIRTGLEALQEINKILFIMKAVAGGIAGISLLVGGIGIMNIMLVSVTERTREIGIRKSFGAKRQDILWQFMLESVVLCLFGGLLGIIFGLLIGAALAAFITQMTHMPFTSVISPSMMFFASGFSITVGIIFGVYPAWKASSLDPVDALRSE